MSNVVARVRGGPLMRLLQPDQRARRSIAFDATFSGLTNAALLVVTNMAATHGASWQHKLMFVLLFAMYVICFRNCFGGVTVLFETALERTRGRVADKLRGLDLGGLDQLDRSAVYNRLTQQTAIISDAAGVLAASLQSIVLVAVTAGYLATLSLPAFALTVVVIGGGILVYVIRAEDVNDAMRETTEREMGFFEAIGDLINGFKELKLSRRRSEALFARLGGQAGAVRALKVRTADMFNTNYIFAYSLFYALIGVMVFVLPAHHADSGAEMMRLTAIVLFVIGPLSTVIAGIPALSKSTLAATAIETLQADLDRLSAQQGDAPASGPLEPRTDFSTIGLRDVSFRYPSGNGGFGVGPLDLTVRRGEILFITGGNGSGKSTLLKLLCTLYQPTVGEVLLDGQPVTPSGRQAYREMFSAVFTDFHLFKTLDSADGVTPASVEALLQLMRLDGKTEFADDRFTNLDLSTGQRKRLALVVALLENRPILIFDEWAADQDPEFRRYFYERLLPDLRRQGKTVVAVTHDEHFLHHADRLVKMDDGRVAPYEPPPHGTSAPREDA